MFVSFFTFGVIHSYVFLRLLFGISSPLGWRCTVYKLYRLAVIAPGAKGVGFLSFFGLKWKESLKMRMDLHKKGPGKSFITYIGLQ